MLKIKKKTQRSTKYESQVWAILSQGPSFCTSLEGFKNYFSNELAGLPRKSTGAPSDFYKLEAKGQDFEVWHLNVLGEPDRLLAVVTFEN